MHNIAKRLQELGISLPRPAQPVAAYRPWVRFGPWLLVSGQLPLKDGELLHSGRVGRDCTLEQAYAAARLCAINCLAQAAAALDGELERIEQVVRLAGYVNAGCKFGEHPQVVNGASELMEQVFGERGRHARVAVGCSSLPLGAVVEVEATFAIRD